MALTADRSTPSRSGDTLSLGVAANKELFAGALVARDASGYATPGAVATTLQGVGRAEEHVDNNPGSAAERSVTIRRGVFKFANSADADLIDNGDIGSDCYIVDDQTVALTDGTGTRSVAGKVWLVDDDGGVWVDFR